MRQEVMEEEQGERYRRRSGAQGGEGEGMGIVSGGQVDRRGEAWGEEGGG